MKKIKLNTTPYIYKVNDVKVIRINMLFPVEIESRYTDVYRLVLMCNLLSNSSKIYNEIDLFSKVLNRNFIIRYNLSYTRYDNQLFICVNYVVPKEGLVDNYSLDNAFKLLYEFLYNPDVSEGAFNIKNFNWYKDILLKELKQEANNIYDLSLQEMDEFFDPDSKYFIHQKERIELVKKTNPKNVYEYYKKNIKNNKFVTFICGAIEDKNKILNIFNKYFKQEEYSFEMNVELFRFIPYKNYQEKIINTKYNQSVVYQIYQVVNMKEKDEYILRMLYFFLYSRENNLIFDTLRSKHNLVYEASVENDSIHGLLYIRTLMDKRDRELINKLIHETIFSIKDKEVFERCKNNLMISLKYDLLDEEDDSFCEVVARINKILKRKNDISHLIKKMAKINYEQMEEFLTRFKLSRNLFMEGGHYEEDL